MIINIPPPNDFKESGLSLLNFAWDTVISLLTNIDEAPDWGIDVDEVSEAFWQASKQHLMTSLSLTQQGVEFIIKGRISEISPYLLILVSPKDWPKNCHKNNTSFAEFRTIDAQDLIKVYNTCATDKFDQSFIAKFDELRKKRNSIMHTIDKRITLHALEIIAEILSLYKILFPGDSWISTRRRFIEEAPLTELAGFDLCEYRVIEEFSMLANLLKPIQTREFLNFNKRQRRYICPQCEYNTSDGAIEPRTALLSPNSSKSKKIYCFICDEKHDVLRKPCLQDDCKGNVISKEYEVCVTCRHNQ